MTLRAFCSSTRSLLQSINQIRRSPLKQRGLRGQFKLATTTKQALGQKIFQAFTNQALAW
jgi:hypothetical protein